MVSKCINSNLNFEREKGPLDFWNRLALRSNPPTPMKKFEKPKGPGGFMKAPLALVWIQKYAILEFENLE